MANLKVTDFTGPLDRDVTQEIILVQGADEMPIYSSLIARGQARPTMAEKVEWSTQSLDGRRTAINNAPDNYDENTTSIVVDDGTVFYANSLILFEATGEVGLVTAVATNTLTVVRGVGSVVAAAAGSVADNANVQCVGAAAGEGAPKASARNYDPTLDHNYLQTFRDTVGLTGRMQRHGTLTEDERARLRRTKFEDHIRSIERSIVFGARSSGVTDGSGNRVTTMGGILQHVTTNVDDVAGTMSKARLDLALRNPFAYGSPEKFMFCGTLMLETCNQLYHGAMQVMSGSVAAGLTIRKIFTSHGTVNLIPHRALVGPHAGYGLVVDPAQAEIRYSEGWLPHLKADIQTPGTDAVEDEWRSELCLTWGMEQAHAVIKGVTGAT